MHNFLYSIKDDINIIAIDIDSENTEILKKKFTGPANFQFLTDDILKSTYPLDIHFALSIL